jgi:hypothetical protein
MISKSEITLLFRLSYCGLLTHLISMVKPEINYLEDISIFLNLASTGMLTYLYLREM